MTLVLPPRLTDSAVALRQAAQRRGLGTVQLPTFEVPEGLRAEHVHAGRCFADAVAPALGIALLEAPADWLANLSGTWTRRDIRAMPIKDAYALRRPAFIKSPNDTSIPARIYAGGSRLPGPDAVEPSTMVLVSDVARFTAEYRLFLLDGAVHTGSRYAEDGRLSLGPLSTAASSFGAEVVAALGSTLPSALVVDVGVVDGAWAVIEANAAWASGRYTADADRALDVVLRAARPAKRIAARDRCFIRPGIPGS